LSNSDQESSPRVNIVKNIIIKPNRDYEESDSDRKSEDSVARKPSIEDERELHQNAPAHNYLTLFSQTIANSNSLRPLFQFKMDPVADIAAKAIIN